MEINRNNIMKIVNKSNAHPDKDYGQNFLIDPNVSEQIVNALEVVDGELVLEIGPGLGSLTHFLADYKNIDVCDIDCRMIDFLKIIYVKKINYILDDVRKINVSHYDKVIGNLPYNITSELVTFLLINAKKATKMVLMCQQEAFNHFYDVSGKEYGPISVLLHLLGDIKKELTLKPGYFYPAPKCNSLVFSFIKDEKANYDDAIGTFKLAKSLFLNRRKTIYNNLKNYFKDSERAKKVLDDLKIEYNKRPEDISPLLFLDIYKNVKLL